jgi:hypothetical protein
MTGQISDPCCHKIIKRKNGIENLGIDNLANFLSISPNQTKFLPSVCLAPELEFLKTLWGLGTE